MKVFSITFLLIASIFVVSVYSMHPSSDISSRPLIRSDRVKRQWYNMNWGWTGWRCAGVNGLFLNCVGKK
ncbi:hypothetical protein QR680_000595 [Steinernema hermaphroditum]|uniref:Uncharacterized protein n=1 Tax=Steinernema hermaphroditum TaxID=289476 RepID=A0AA39GV52_9BILA|nr:hypothetical protein QR680_000595 [Steinernema hermaphroditum]